MAIHRCGHCFTSHSSNAHVQAAQLLIASFDASQYPSKQIHWQHSGPNRAAEHHTPHSAAARRYASTQPPRYALNLSSAWHTDTSPASSKLLLIAKFASQSFRLGGESFAIFAPAQRSIESEGLGQRRGQHGVCKEMGVVAVACADWAEARVG
jgi:hypothetical protein